MHEGIKLLYQVAADEGLRYNILSVGNDFATLADFQKLDLRVGKVLTVEKVAGSDKLVRLRVDLGDKFGSRQILAGIANWFTEKQLVGKKFIFAANLEPKKMMGVESQGMMLAADVKGECKLIPIDKSIPVGTEVR